MADRYDTVPRGRSRLAVRRSPPLRTQGVSGVHEIGSSPGTGIDAIHELQDTRLRVAARDAVHGAQRYSMYVGDADGRVFAFEAVDFGNKPPRLQNCRSSSLR